MEDRKIKISFIISSSEIGGTEKMLLSMIESLDRKVFERPSVFTIKGRGKFTMELERIDVLSYTLNLKKNPFLFFPLLYRLWKESPDIIHSFLFYGNIAGRVCGRLIATRLVISSQRSIDSWRRWHHWKVDGITSAWADLIISNSLSGKEVLVQKSGIPGEKIIVISNGISSRKIPCTVTRKSLGIGDSGLVVGTIGNLRKAKGHMCLVESAGRVLKECPDIYFVIAGEGNMRQALAERVEKMGMSGRFIFTGFRRDAEELLQLFDIFVLPSLWEGFPVSLLEAMKYGKPAVAFGVSDIPRIIEDGKSGIVVEPGSVSQLSAGLVKMLKNGDMRREMGMRAGEIAIEKYSLEEMMRKYTRAYTDNLKMVDFNNN